MSSNDLWIQETKEYLRSKDVCFDDFTIRINNNNFNAPITYRGKNLIELNLNRSVERWRVIYQLSHEAIHAYISKIDLNKRIRWFEEVICCTASYYSLKDLNEDKALKDNTKYKLPDEISDIEKANKYIKDNLGFYYNTPCEVYNEGGEKTCSSAIFKFATSEFDFWGILSVIKSSMHSLSTQEFDVKMLLETMEYECHERHFNKEYEFMKKLFW